MLLAGAVTTDGHVGYVAGRYRSGVWVLCQGAWRLEARIDPTPQQRFPALVDRRS
jgi:hypothetical protein